MTENKHIESLENAIAYAHGRLETELACPPPEKMPEGLRALADDLAGWVEVAIEHNKQCAQLNPHRHRCRENDNGLCEVPACVLLAVGILLRRLKDCGHRRKNGRTT